MLSYKRVSKLLKTSISILQEKFSKNGVSIGYYNIDNFGDQLSPDIIKYFGSNAIHCPSFRYSSAICVGSILHMIPDNYSGTILGSGSISGQKQRFPDAKVLMVRGDLTRQCLGLPEKTLLGDPGLISDMVYSDVICDEKEWDVGIVPHYLDIDDKVVSTLCISGIGIKVKVIDVRKPPEVVVKEISCCKNIISSSLHGLIVADSLGTPNLWVKFSNKLIGGNFKFEDYYSSFSIKRKPVCIKARDSLSDIIAKTEEIPRNRVDKIKNNIHAAYTTFTNSVTTR